MPEMKLRPGSLVLYKSRPGHVRKVDKKLEIEVEGGNVISVRRKDVVLLHPGPVPGLDGLQAIEGEIETAWEILAGESTDLRELAELAYGEFTPATAWASWQEVTDGLYFSGSPQGVNAHTPEEVARLKEDRLAKESEQQAWEAFVERFQNGRFLPEDERYLKEVEALAWGTQEYSRVLRALGHTESPQNAHALLLAIGYWGPAVNPFPAREVIATSPPKLSLPDLSEETRQDLTHLSAWAIDDEGNQDPDDALSLEGDRLWIHIADVAALVRPDSPADQEARARGANLYLPEGTVPMLPPRATRKLGLGLSELSPALSFALDFGHDGEIASLEITPSWVRVQRMTYDEAEARLEEAPFKQMVHYAQRYEAQRHRNGAIRIELPEVKVQVNASGEVEIRPVPALRSRDMVREAMLMTGEAVARFALKHDIPVPFTAQDAPEDELENGFDQAMASSMSGMFATRRMLRRGQQQSSPAPHAGLGMDLYTQCTSPLRRYLDLVVHQQLRAHLLGETLLDVQAVMARVGAADAVTGSVRRAERLSIVHWTLVYLLQHPDWKGEGVVVDRRGKRVHVLIPELGLETQLYPRRELALNSNVNLALLDVNLADQEAHFRIAR